MADPIREDQVVKIDLAKDLDVPPGQMSVAYRDYIREGTSRPGTEEPSLIKPAGEVAATQPGEAAALSDVSVTPIPAVQAALLETASQQATVTTAATEQSTVTRSTEQKSSLRESAARVPAAIRTTGS